MRKSALIFPVLILIAASVSFAAADNIEQHLFVQQDGNGCPQAGCAYAAWFYNLWWYERTFGPYQTFGSADFSPVAPPWALTFHTSVEPDSWEGECIQGTGVCTYDAHYSRGPIYITGPDGLDFAGGIFGDYDGVTKFDTFGYRWFSGEETVAFDFIGRWSNGVQGYGTLYEHFSYYVDVRNQIQTFHNEARLDIYEGPEPGTLVMMGGGVLVLLARLRKHVGWSRTAPR